MQRKKLIMSNNCYIHIPFCHNICSYCDFCKLLYNKKIVSNYLEELAKEISLIYQGEELKTIYIGGGTPSALSLEELEILFKILNMLNKSKEIEYTIEGNFESTTKEKLLLYKKYGINRLSFGLESISDKNLQFLERTVIKKQVKEVIKEARKLGFNNINIDLMYALPTETEADLNIDLDYILSLNVEHISTYSLIIEPHTKLSIKSVKNIDEDLDFKMYNLICEKLKLNNYYHYEISNFSKKGFQSKHNLCYWNNQEYYGFGLGASSFLNNCRINNTKSINKYLEGNFCLNKEILSEKDKIEYEIMLNLRKSEGINLEKFREKFGKEFNSIYNYNSLLKDGFLIEKDNYLFLPEEKWYISNEIIIRIIEGEVNG